MSKGDKFIFYGIVAGVLLGGLCGWFFGQSMQSISFMGDLFLDALKMMVVPLVFFSLIVGITSLGDIRKIGRTGFYTVAFFLSTTLMSVIVGLVLVNIIRPGEGFEETAAAVMTDSLAEKLSDSSSTSVTGALISILRSFIPQNIIGAAVENKVLPIILFGLVLGGVLTTMGEKAKPVLEFCDSMNTAIMKIVHLIMYFAPFGIFALIASKLGAQGGGPGFLKELSSIGWYAATVITGLGVHALFVLPLILWIVTKRSPLAFFRSVMPALITSFSTASSSATLPVTMECLRDKSKLRSEIVDFVPPVGATVNMDGTALYEAVAAVFIGQAFAVAAGVPLGMTQMIIIAITATLAAIGAAGIPQAGLVTMLIVLTSVNYPPEVIAAGMASILTIDWFLDRCRTSVNVWGDCIGTAVVEKLSTPKGIEVED